MKKALITGITGQDGSYLAELLLAKGYEVHGLIRRSSSFNTGRIDGLYEDPHVNGVHFFLHYGDVSDSTNLIKLLYRIQPDEVYHLAAQSHVRVSFDTPEYTGDVTGLGTVRILEAIREVGLQTRFYQAGSSEMFGLVQEVPQRETTPFYPRSPYGAAKLYAHWVTVNYRESYGLFACNGIMFNHECLAAQTPLLLRQNGMVRVDTPAAIVPLRRKGRSVQTFKVPNLEIWDGCQWTPVLTVTATRRRRTDPNHDLLSIQARAGVVEATRHHHMLRANGEQTSAESLTTGDTLALAERFPDTPNWTCVLPEMAEFLGLMTAEGYVGERHIRFTNNDKGLLNRMTELWMRLFLGEARRHEGLSGWNPERPVGVLDLTGCRTLCDWLRSQLYTTDGHKQIPPLIFNSSPDVQRTYLEGYYAGDGLKAGNGASVKTNSAVLAQGLCWLYALQGQAASVYVEYRGSQTYYQLNLSSSHQLGAKGQHLRKNAAEVRRVVPAQTPAEEWVFDLETGSGILCAGVGRIVVHNSPRRGETFVTRKITRAVAHIKAGLQHDLYLGNLDARRDWGYAKEYVEAMWLMLQQEAPDDYVIATGETHSVREFLEVAFGHAGLDYRRYIKTDPKYYRPAEVDLLRGDASKARAKLGWAPQTTFEDLVRLMVDEDIALLSKQNTKAVYVLC